MQLATIDIYYELLISISSYDKNVNYKAVEHHQFSTKRHCANMNATNRTLNISIYMFVISETVASRKLNVRRWIIYRTKNVLNHGTELSLVISLVNEFEG